jgi:hypothetical protein
VSTVSHGTAVLAACIAECTAGVPVICKVAPLHAMKACGGSEDRATLILNLGTSGGEW